MSGIKKLQPMIANAERAPFVWLLVAQLAFIVTSPLIVSSETGQWVRIIGLFAILLSGVYAAAVRRGFLIIALFLMLPAIFAWLGPDVFNRVGDEVLRLLSAAACLIFTCVVIMSALYKQKKVSQETIIGGIDAYLLIGIFFMLLHQAAAIVDPTAYTLHGQPMDEFSSPIDQLQGVSTMLYFSFTTLTTLGYGDITPETGVARLLTSAEAVTGQLYVAIFIARLVSIQVTQGVINEELSE